MSKWTINESIKSQLNVSINNKNPSKDTMEIKLYSSKGLDDLDIPEEYKGWVLDQTSSKTTDAGRLFITATYKRKEDESGSNSSGLSDGSELCDDLHIVDDVEQHHEVAEQPTT